MKMLYALHHTYKYCLSEDLIQLGRDLSVDHLVDDTVEQHL